MTNELRNVEKTFPVDFEIDCFRIKPTVVGLNQSIPIKSSVNFGFFEFDANLKMFAIIVRLFVRFSSKIIGIKSSKSILILESVI